MILTVLACSVGACKKSTSKPVLRAENIKVINEANAALYARIEFNLSRSVPAFISYWEKGSTQVIRSYTSVSRQRYSIPLFFLKENTAYEFKIETDSGPVEDPSGVQSFTTAAIPEEVKLFYKESGNTINDPNKGYYFFTSRTSPACMYLVDNKGKLVWYRRTPHMLKVVRLTQYHTLLALEDENNTSFGDGNVLLETTLAGDTLFYLKQGQKGFDKSIHHDIGINAKGNIVAVTNVFKGGSSIPGDGLIELDRSGAKIWEWTTFDSPDAADMGINQQPWINSLFIDKDNNYIVSLRAFSHVWKINASTGTIMWKLGKGGNVQMNAADEFLFQHYAHRNPAGDIMLFDNGGVARPVTRVLSFNLDEQTKKATTVLNLSLPANYYSAIMGNAMFMPDQSVLATSATNGTIIKSDVHGNIAWTLKVKDPIYRGEYVGDPFLPL